MSCNHGHSSYPEFNYTSGAKWSKNLTKDRLGTFNGGHYSDVNLGAVLFTHRIDNAEHVKLKVYVSRTSRLMVWSFWAEKYVLHVQMERTWVDETDV